MGGGHNLSSYKGFTLAEVLVTLGIIGVVSAMTVPTLMQNHQKKTYITKLHKVYNNLSQALLQFQTDRNAVSLKESGLISYGINNFFKNYLKVVQDCGNDANPCFADSYRKIAGTNSAFTCYLNCVVLADGSAIGIGVNDISSDIIQFVVDINGKSGPNIFGRDAFSLFLYTGNGVIDDLTVTNDTGDPVDDVWNITAFAPLTKEQREKNFQDACISDTSTRFHGCFGKILNDNWEMNY